LLVEGGDAITEVPGDRWEWRTFYADNPSAVATAVTRWGGFLDGIDQFDAQFFGITPRQAASIDPQQRLLLEVGWEALEDAGIVPTELAGSLTGVFVGISSNEYWHFSLGPDGRDAIGPYTNLGGSVSIAANRLSHALDLRGPSVALDTACSSSLVALHIACQSLAVGESILALAGGVNVLLRPELTIGYSKASMLSPDGRCFAFDARANGYVRSEGAVLLVLRRYSEAVRRGEPVYAVILATGVNQDGHTAGVSTPNRDAQVDLLREIYRRALVRPEDVGYVEAHGTGTPVGDAAEAVALGRALGGGRTPDRPLAIGSVKTNIGHLESGAGAAGVAKVALALWHGSVPASLHLRTPNPDIDFAALGLRVQAEYGPWMRPTGRAIAGVNSFGFGGTNAHAVLAEVSPADRPAVRAGGDTWPACDFLLPLSARSEEALKAVASAYAAALGRSPIRLADFCYSAGARRAHHRFRAVILSPSVGEAQKVLHSIAKGQPEGVTHGVVPPEGVGRLCFVYAGMGPQWHAMGRQLYKAEPVFREVIDQCDAVLSRLTGWSLVKELAQDEASSRMEQTAVAQPANYALQVGLTALWRSWGVEPAAVVGHSAGEVAAGCAAGVYTTEEGCRIIYHRSRLQQRAAGCGALVALGVTEEEIHDALSAEGGVELAAVNGPRSLTLVGDRAALERIVAPYKKRGVFYRFLRPNVPFHSRYMDPIAAELREAIGVIDGRLAAVPLYSAVDGRLIGSRPMDADYWWGNVRHPVRFADAIGRLLEDGYRSFLEISPHPVLGENLQECARRRLFSVLTFDSLRRGTDECRQLRQSLAALYCAGAPVRWEALLPSDVRYVRLPTYPWQRQRFWLEPDAWRRDRLRPADHPLLGRLRDQPGWAWDVMLDLTAHPWLKDHTLRTSVVFPAAAYLEMFLAAARLEGTAASGDCLALLLVDVEFREALFLHDGARTNLATTLETDSGRVTIHARTAGGRDASDGSSAWSLHATARRMSAPVAGRPAAPDLIRSRCPEACAADDLYAELGAAGLQYGPCFRGLRSLRRGQDEALGELTLPPAIAGSEGYGFHPVLFDSAFQVALAAGQSRDRRPYLPVRIRRVKVLRQAAPGLLCHAVVSGRNRDACVFDVRLIDTEGQTYVEIEGLECWPLGRPSGAHPPTGEEPSLASHLYELKWVERPPAAVRPGRLLAPARIAQDTESDWRGLEHDFRQVEGQLHGAALCHIQRAIATLAGKWKLGDTLREGEVEGAAAGNQRELVRLFLSHLCDHGFLSRTPDGWQVVRADCPPTRTADRSDYPDLELLDRCGRSLAPVLKGELSSLAPIFPADEPDAAFRFYAEGRMFRRPNRLAGRVVRLLAEALPADARLRVLEVGAGTGGLTAHLLPELQPDRTDYLFTDISPHFTAAAVRRFREYPFVRTSVLDVTRPPAAQGYAPESFDLVVAANVVHATPSVGQSLENLRDLLAPGGLLLLLEVTAPQVWGDVIFGPTEGWWLFADRDLRPTYPLMPPARWEAALAAAGLDDARTLADPDREGDPTLALMLARKPLPDVGPARWLILGDVGGVAEGLLHKIERRGDQGVVVRPGPIPAEQGGTILVRPDSRDDLRHAVRLACRSGPLSRIAHLWGLDAPLGEATDLPRLWDAEERACGSALNLLNVLASDTESRTAQVTFVTRAAQAVHSGEATRSPVPATLLGLARVAANEFPHHRCRTIDLPADPPADEAGLLLEAILQDDAEAEVALRGSASYVPRVVPRDEATRPVPPADPPPVRVVTAGVGSPENLRVRVARRRPPGPDEIEIEVRAAGLNFKDVLKVMGLLSEEVLARGFFGTELGMECSGVVVAVGDRVAASGRPVRVGDQVVALAPRALGSYVTTRADYAAAKPAGLSFEQAAGVPIAFFTAVYALEHVARLRPGERVLIHSAAGGVGQAAVRVARRIGAEVFATAGSPERRTLLRAQGIRCVADSRGLDFPEVVRAETGGRGVEVVLNSLPGPAVEAGIAALAPYGRFVELGKLDIDRNRLVGLRPFGENLTFAAVDVDRLMLDRPEVVAPLFRELIDRFRRGEFDPPAVASFPATDAVGAFRHLAAGKHVGKVVVTFDRLPAEAGPMAPDAPVVRPDGTYLITGGLGGFGLRLAAWLVGFGARHLALVGRRGADDDTRRRVRELEAAGAAVRVIAADVSVESEVTGLLGQLRAEMPPLRGLFHAAMVLDDGFLLQLDWEQFRRVLAPKVAGAWNLHRATQDCPLDHFVVFSSITAVAGSQGQGNYVAANAFLDALAEYRRGLGLPALSINWGALGGVGYVARHEDIAAYLERTGLRRLDPDDAVQLLEFLMGGDAARAIAADVDWQRLRGAQPAIGGTRFPQIGTPPLTPAEPAAEPSVTDVSNPVTDRLRAIVHHILRLPADGFDPHVRLTDVGLDSLMSLELKIAIQKELGVEVPVAILSRGASVAELAELLASRSAGTAPVGAEPGVGPPDAPPAARTKAPPGSGTGPTANGLADVERRPQAQPSAQSARPSARDSRHATDTSPSAGSQLLVPLGHGSSGNPLVFVPSGSNGLLSFGRLAEVLGLDRPCFGVLPPTLVQLQGSRGERRERVIADYVEAICALRSGGPVHLVGYSLGGVIAFEIAQQLNLRRERVGLLALLDTPFGVAGWMTRLYRLLAGGPRSAPLRSVVRAEAHRAAELTFTDEGVKAQLRVMAGYAPKPYPGRIAYVMAEGSFLRLTGAAPRWCRVALGGFDLRTIPGRHFAMFRDPALSVLARELTELCGPGAE
jgi:acyl transferase domain-containing protein/NADPH:quinone reductase-like Zn-dependent oxidoreductase/thioesterase domain-containing protein/acyl carrier protein